MDQTISVLINFFSASAGVVLTILTGFIINLYRTHRRAETHDLKIAMDAIRREREQLMCASDKVRVDLQGQILELRKQLLDVQNDNIKYVRENSELRQQVMFLTNENAELKFRLRELEAQVGVLTTARVQHAVDIQDQVITNAPNSHGTVE